MEAGNMPSREADLVPESDPTAGRGIAWTPG